LPLFRGLCLAMNRVGVEDWHEGSLYFSCYPRSDRPMPMSVGVFSSDPVCRDGV